MGRGRRLASFKRHVPTAIGLAVLLAAAAYVARKAFGAGFGSTGDAPTFVVVTLNGLSLAGLYFLTASGFTLIFGLMRVVNMAHGVLYLFGGYMALTLMDHGFAWWLAALVAAALAGVPGSVVQQLLLRWN